MKKNDILTGTVVGYGSEGEGVIKTDGYVVFVPFTIVGEKISYRVLKVKGQVLYARLESVIEPSKDRVKPECPVYERCGGCRLLHMSYEAQLEYKRELIATDLKKIAFCDTVVEPTVASNPHFRYRNKLQLPLRSVDGKNVVGFFARNSHRVVPINDCLIQGEWCSGAIRAVLEYADENKIDFYDETSNNGLIRHLLVKKVGESFLACIVATACTLPDFNSLVLKLKKYLNTDNVTLTLNVNRSTANVVLGDKTIVLFGDGVVYGEQFGVKYGVGTESFIQVNDDVKERLYKDAVNAACESSPSLVIDAYCGGGLMTALLARRAKRVVGVEIVDEAVENAKRLAKDNGVQADFICAPCEDVLPELVKNADGDSVVLLDPPRKGIDKRLIEPLLNAPIKKIVYISCNPSTLARDVGLLTGKLVYGGNALVKNPSAIGGSFYSVSSVAGYDMFANCAGVETLVVLSRKKPDATTFAENVKGN